MLSSFYCLVKNALIEVLHEQYYKQFFDEQGEISLDFDTARKLENAILLSQTIKRIPDQFCKFLPNVEEVITKEKMDDFVQRCEILGEIMTHTDPYFHFMLPKPIDNDLEFQSDLALVKHLSVKKSKPDVYGRIPVYLDDNIYGNILFENNLQRREDIHKRICGKFEGHVENLQLKGDFLTFRIESFLFSDAYFDVNIAISDIMPLLMCQHSPPLACTKRSHSDTFCS